MFADTSLSDGLADVLPKDFKFRIYHLSTPPTKTLAIYSAPPNTRPDRTYCENHFLAVSINTSTDVSNANPEDSSELLVFAVEVLIYSTAFSTTFFVSKADSTGYLHLLKLPKGTSSPLKTVSSTFVEYLVQNRQRIGIRSIVSLFARAQDQYLFPGSIENKGKHVLDDRGLVRWWCRVLDPVIVKCAKSIEGKKSLYKNWENIKGYLVVPGSDSAMSYLPLEARTGPMRDWRWKIGHPLEEISRYPDGVPPRCLIPRFPDDPKARYLDDLDSELKSKSADGQWRSVKTVEQFWDAMTFRQECSAGRMVGFLWVVFTPENLRDDFGFSADASESQNMDSQTTVASGFAPSTSSFVDVPSSPATSFMPSSQMLPPSPMKSFTEDFPPNSQQSFVSTQLEEDFPKQKRKKLRGPITPRQPKVKTKNSLQVSEFPVTTPYYSCPLDSRGQVVLAEKDYKRVTELLLRLDFANESLASQSSSRWINEVRSRVANSDDPWGTLIVGKHKVEVKVNVSSTGVNSLGMGLVRRKRKPESQDASAVTASAQATSTTPAVNVLGAGMIRKKPKV